MRLRFRLTKAYVLACALVPLVIISFALRSPRTPTQNGRLVDWYTMQQGAIALIEDRWADAVKLLQSVNRARFRPDEALYLDNNIAWALAHDGRAGEAMALAKRALEGAYLIAPRLVPYCHGTLGVAQLKSGDAHAAVASLKESLRAPFALKNAQVIREYYLGEALLALGRLDEAVPALERASRWPELRWSARARARLGELAKQTPYRSNPL
jgi:tetratricopeptide (TPR) repeat protein